MRKTRRTEREAADGGAIHRDVPLEVRIGLQNGEHGALGFERIDKPVCLESQQQRQVEFLTREIACLRLQLAGEALQAFLVGAYLLVGSHRLHARFGFGHPG